MDIVCFDGGVGDGVNELSQFTIRVLMFVVYVLATCISLWGQEWFEGRENNVQERQVRITENKER